MTTSHFHEGERSVQQTAGEAAIAEHNRAMVAASISSGARPFLQRQVMAVLASVDADGQPCSSVLYGEPGFIDTDSSVSLSIGMPLGARDATDPLWANVAINPVIGLLFIDLGSRRRYRINGSVHLVGDHGIDVSVREAYPNCPKYIQRRYLRAMDSAIDSAMLPAMLGEGALFSPDVRDLARRADTVFVASNHARNGADASHRGGNPGFVQVLEDTVLRLPDYPGNSMFNTLGNLAVDPRVGLCIPDFDGQRLLQIRGRARLLFDQHDPAQLSGGTGRFWEIDVDAWLLRRTPRRLAWEYHDASPFNPASVA